MISTDLVVTRSSPADLVIGWRFDWSRLGCRLKFGNPAEGVYESG